MLDALTGRPGFVRLLDAAEALSGLDLRTVASKGTDAQLADTRAAQPLMYLADWAWGSAALAAGIRPVALAGHSLGELAALALAGVFSVEAGLELVVERSRLMSECARTNPGAMAAVLGLESHAILSATASIDGVWVANDNAPGQVVVSGTVAGVAAAQDALLAAGARRVVPLPVSGGFHTVLMAPAAAAFRDILESTSFADASVPVYSNADPRASVDAGVLRERLATQMVSPVRWTETTAALRSDGVTTLLEAGPGTVLTGLAKRTDGLAGYAVEQDGISSVLAQEGV
jgi:[acyl-carrier-protein] S-malonyltransferase